MSAATCRVELCLSVLKETVPLTVAENQHEAYGWLDLNKTWSHAGQGARKLFHAKTPSAALPYRLSFRKVSEKKKEEKKTSDKNHRNVYLSVWGWEWVES